MQLLGIEKTELDITQYERLILKQGLSILGEATAKFCSGFDSLTVVFFRPSLQIGCQSQRTISFDCTPDELILITWMTFQIEYIQRFFLRVIDQKTVAIVPVDDFIALQLDIQIVDDQFRSFRCYLKFIASSDTCWTKYHHIGGYSCLAIHDGKFYFLPFIALMVYCDLHVEYRAL